MHQFYSKQSALKVETNLAGLVGIKNVNCVAKVTSNKNKVKELEFRDV